MEINKDLVNDVYRNDQLFQKLKECWEKWKHHADKSKHVVQNGEGDIILLKLKSRFTKYPDILINQLLEVKFGCKDCFKVFLRLYRLILAKDSMSFKCKKEYIRKNTKLNRVTLDKALNELKDKNMILIEKQNGYFNITPNLCFENWNVSDDEKIAIRENNENEIEWYDEKYIQMGNLL